MRFEVYKVNYWTAGLAQILIWQILLKLIKHFVSLRLSLRSSSRADRTMIWQMGSPPTLATYQKTEFLKVCLWFQNLSFNLLFRIPPAVQPQQRRIPMSWPRVGIRIKKTWEQYLVALSGNYCVRQWQTQPRDHHSGDVRCEVPLKISETSSEVCVKCTQNSLDWRSLRTAPDCRKRLGLPRNVSLSD